MTKTFPIDFVRQVIEQTLLEEHIKNNKYYGGKNQVNLFSFYEQLQKDDEVDRYVNCYRDLVDQQNRTGLIMNGTIIAPENPTITNLYQCLIIPMSFTCSFRVKLGNRDSAIETINNLIETLKGRKCDIAEFDNGELFKVGTIANENDGAPSTHNGDFIGTYYSPSEISLTTQINTIKQTLVDKGITFNNNAYYYMQRYNNSYDILDIMSVVQCLSRECNVEIDTTQGCYDINVVEEDELYRISGKIDFSTISSDFDQMLSINGLKVNLRVDSQVLTKEFDNIDIDIDIDNCELENGVISGYGTFSFTSPIASWGGEYDPNEVFFQSIDTQPTMSDWVVITNQEQNPNILFPPNGKFTKYKLSLSFDSLRCDEPRNLNADEYCTISFGGSATLVSNGVALGNDLVKIGIKKTKIMADTPIEITNSERWLEPLEIPSGNNVDTQVNQLVSNKFITNTHSDNISLSLQYTFVCDRTIDYIDQFFKYGRYGIQGTQTDNFESGITPNMIFEVKEIWSSWGDVEVISFKAKIVESIDIENTESDTLSITIPLQIQGENN